MSLLGLLACGHDYNDPHQPVTSSGDQPEASMDTGVKGRVIGPDAAPLMGGVILPKSVDDPPRRVPEIAAVTDRDGRYQWRLLPGDYTISAVADGYKTTTKPVTVEAQHVTTLNFRLRRANPMNAGRTVD